MIKVMCLMAHSFVVIIAKLHIRLNMKSSVFATVPIVARRT